jgi:hypothetical protein
MMQQPLNQTSTEQGLFTARLIASALGNTKRAVLLALAGTDPVSKKLVRGQKARSWAFSALPALMQRQIETTAQARGYHSAEALLASCDQAAAPAPAASPVCQDNPFSNLVTAFADHIADRKALSREDKEWAWRDICLEYRELSAAGSGPERGAVKKLLAAFLLRELPALTRAGARKPLAALRRDFERKWSSFQKSGLEALRDGRRASSGNYREVLCPACWKKFVALAGAKGCNESGAWRKLKESGQLCERCRDRHHFDPRRDKSGVPHSIRQAATPLVDAAKPWVKSDAAGRMAGPYIPRDWSDTEPGDYFVGDDVTPNHDAWDYDEHGKVEIFRPECLYYADERTGYPLDFLLIAGPYNGRHVRRLMLQRNFQSVLGLKTS